MGKSVTFEHGTIPEQHTTITRREDGGVAITFCAEQCREFSEAMGDDYSQGIVWLVNPKLWQAMSGVMG